MFIRGHRDMVDVRVNWHGNNRRLTYTSYIIVNLVLSSGHRLIDEFFGMCKPFLK